MKKAIFAVSFILTITSSVFAQLFGGEKVVIFGIDFRAKEVCGQKKFVGAPDYFAPQYLTL